MPNFFWGFMVGSLAGAYAAQTYDIPKVTDLMKIAKERIGSLEKELPKKKDSPGE